MLSAAQRKVLAWTTTRSCGWPPTWCRIPSFTMFLVTRVLALTALEAAA